ncbi:MULTISPECIES: hypothetical protein [unclassified Kitasatospora]|uniref:hypothetical protein n=1 Tax=unclassified Kitasatospora TaxID=2633591 RepID=UPI00070E729B|nr:MULTISPECIES: hypothetical protein [unclassified Kitasatospora]KQV14629.1 hypothetical protein ASC99_31270 [Kitasatospora sp. Root107]KRB72445.1 hypothetical protein ASE03_23305 [Kitasatospora sp. Root187]
MNHAAHRPVHGDERFTGLEVKSSGLVQAWPTPKKPTPPSWPIARTVPYDVIPYNAADAAFQADVYVFALHVEPDPERYDALDTTQWIFHVLTGAQVAELPRGAKGHALATLRRVQEAAQPVTYQDLRATIESAARG